MLHPHHDESATNTTGSQPWTWQWFIHHTRIRSAPNLALFQTFLTMLCLVLAVKRYHDAYDGQPGGYVYIYSTIDYTESTADPMAFICFFGSSIVTGTAIFQLRNLLLVTFMLLCLSNFLFASELSGYPLGVALTILWILDATMVLSFSTSTRSGRIIGLFVAILSGWPLLQAVILASGGLDVYRFHRAIFITVAGVLFLIKSWQLKHPKQIVRPDGSRLTEFDEPEQNEQDQEQSIQVEMVTIGLPRDENDQVLEEPETEERDDDDDDNKEISSLMSVSASEQSPVVLSRNLWTRYSNEVYMLIQVLIHGQFFLLMPMLFSLGFGHQLFRGNQHRYLLRLNWPFAYSLNIVLSSVARMATSIWFGVIILDQTSRSNFSLVSQRARRAFWIVVAVSIVGVALTVATEVFFVNYCGGDINCTPFLTDTLTGAFGLLVATSISQAAMEATVLCFSLWILATMSAGSFSMAARYMSLMGGCTLVGHFAGQKVSRSEIGINFVPSNGTVQGQVEHWIVAGVWMGGVLSFEMLRRFVVLDGLETREVKGEMEVKEGDADLEVK